MKLIVLHQITAVGVESDHIVGGSFIEWLLTFFFGEQNDLKAKNEIN